jgi:hypothetical protein
MERSDLKNAVVKISSEGCRYLDTGNLVLYIWKSNLMDVDSPRGLRPEMNHAEIVETIPWLGIYRWNIKLHHIFTILNLLEYAKREGLLLDENLFPVEGKLEM